MQTCTILLIHADSFLFHTSGDHSTYIPAHQSDNVNMLAAMHSVEMQQDVTTLMKYAEMTNMEVVFANRTSCYKTEKVTTVNYPGLELVPVDERRVTSIEMGRKVATPYSHLGTSHFSKTSSVTNTRECPSRTEHTLVTCVESVKPNDGLLDKTQPQ